MSDEHDITKNILNTIREGKLHEAAESSVDLEGVEFDNQKKKFNQQGADGGVFHFFKIYPNNRNAVFSGTLDNGIEWQYSRVDGVYFKAPNMELTEAIVENIRRIYTYKINWDQEWNQKINEFTGSQNDNF